RDVYRGGNGTAAHQARSLAESGAGGRGASGDSDRGLSSAADTLHSKGGRLTGAQDLRLLAPSARGLTWPAWPAASRPAGFCPALDRFRIAPEWLPITIRPKEQMAPMQRPRARRAQARTLPARMRRAAPAPARKAGEAGGTSKT